MAGLFLAVSALLALLSTLTHGSGSRTMPVYTPPDSTWTSLPALAANLSATAFRDNLRVKHVTVATRPKFGLQALRTTAAWHGDNLKELGMGDPRFIRWGYGFGVKLEAAREEFRLMNGDDIVLFTDAYDVLLVASQVDLRAAFVTAVARAMLLEPNDPSGVVPARTPTVVFSTEVFCWPDDFKATLYPEADQRAVTQYLNSGTYMGRVRDLLALMDTLQFAVSTDDQRYFTELYFNSRLDASLPRMALDHAHDVFLCTNGFSVGKEIVYSPSRRRWKHVSTPGLPAVLHFNGDSKWNMPGFFDVLQGSACYLCPWVYSLSGQGVLGLSALLVAWLLSSLVRTLLRHVHLPSLAMLRGLKT